MDELPFLTVVMPVRNEEAHLSACLDTVLGQDYPRDRYEVLVAEGASTDRTRAIILDYARRDPRVRLVENPEGIVSTGLNRAVRAARGGIVVRMDGHAEFSSDFLLRNIEILSSRPEVWSCGGPIIHVGVSSFGKAAALAMSHPLGVGNAAHRFADYEGYGEGAAFPAIRKWVFDRVGYFDEELVRNQDDEFNFRMTQAGGKVFISPKVRYRYFVRESPGRLWRQYFQYGYWRIPVLKKHRRPTTLRQLAPSVFFLGSGVLGVVGLGIGNAVLALALPTAYVSVLLVAGALLARGRGAAVGSRVPAALAIMHAGYAAGIAYGLWSWGIARSGGDKLGSMARVSR